MYFSKKAYAVYNGVWGKATEAARKFSRIFVLKVTLQSVRLGLLLTVSYRKNGIARMQDVLVAPPNNSVGEQLLPLLHRFQRLW